MRLNFNDIFHFYSKTFLVFFFNAFISFKSQLSHNDPLFNPLNIFSFPKEIIVCKSSQQLQFTSDKQVTKKWKEKRQFSLAIHSGCPQTKSCHWHISHIKKHFRCPLIGFCSRHLVLNIVTIWSLETVCCVKSKKLLQSDVHLYSLILCQHLLKWLTFHLNPLYTNLLSFCSC